MSELYLLWASQGEYSDRSEWPIALYEMREDAEAAVVRGMALFREIMGSRGYVAYEERGKKLKTKAAKELTALLGCEPSLYDELTLYCCPMEVRSALGIEAATAVGTTQIGPTEGESPTAKPERPNTGPHNV